MNPNYHLRRRRVLISVLAVGLLPVSTFAQAGLSGDPFSGQQAEREWRPTNSKFDTGFRSKSALGQLEELTGSKVDRSSPAQAPAPQAAPKISKSAQMRADFNRELTGMLAEALIQQIFSDDSAKRAAQAEAAARAAAEAEAFRVQQELARIARIQQAQRERGDWDLRDREIGGRLGDVFTVGTGTSFFGQPAGPDAAGAALLSDVGEGTSSPPAIGADFAGSDPSVVDLRESSLVVQPFDQPTRPLKPAQVPPISWATAQVPRSAHDWPEHEASPPPRQKTPELFPYFGSWLGDLYWDLAEGSAKATAWGTLEHVRGQAYVKALSNFNASKQGMIEGLVKSNQDLMDAGLYRSRDLVYAMGSRNRSGAELIDPYFNNLDHSARKVVVDLAKLVYGWVTEQFGEIDLGKAGFSALESGD